MDLNQKPLDTYSFKSSICSSPMVAALRQQYKITTISNTRIDNNTKTILIHTSPGSEFMYEYIHF